jgi:LysR family hca operon transcriptional activator
VRTSPPAGKLDIAFLRREQKPDLEYKLVAKEPLVELLL